MSVEPSGEELAVTGMYHHVIVPVLQVARQHEIVATEQIRQVCECLVLAGDSLNVLVQVTVVDDQTEVSTLLRLQAGPRDVRVVLRVLDHTQA